jgi:hypothetical protein
MLTTCWPKPSLALQLPVDAAPPRAPHTSSSPACIANVQEQPCITVAAKSGRQAGCGGGGGKAMGRLLGRPPSIGQEQCVYTLRRTAATTIRSCAQAHDISTSRCTTATTTRSCVQAHNIYTSCRTTATMTRPRAQAHAIFNVALHDGNKDNKKTAATTPYVDYESNHARAVSYHALPNGSNNNKNGDNAIVFHIASCDGNDDNNKLRHQT